MFLLPKNNNKHALTTLKCKATSLSFGAIILGCHRTAEATQNFAAPTKAIDLIKSISWDADTGAIAINCTATDFA